MAKGTYPRGEDYPNEKFIQNAIEDYAASQGWTKLTISGHTDLVCEDPATGRHWRIEAKGETEAPSTDFHTALGQLLHRAERQDDNYALAIPDGPKLLRLCGELPPWVRERLNLHIMVVTEDGGTRVCGPSEPLPGHI